MQPIAASSDRLQKPPATPIATARAALELLKPITWFPPMWAFACGMVSSGLSLEGRAGLVAAGVFLAGPLLCGTSQVVNDWFDRHVDAINEPDRPIPSGRIPGRWGLYYAIVWTGLSILVSFSLGPWVAWASLLGLFLAWAYSAPPFRLKSNGWIGNAAVALSYEGLAWITGTAVMLGGAMPSGRTIGLALLYSLGAHGIMTLNDFKSVEGDLKMNIASIPAQLGVDRAARLACVVMALPQIMVIALLLSWSRPLYAAAVAGLLLAQFACMPRLLRDPKAGAPWYGATGITLYVSGMMVSAFAIR